ncbi:unnamed protein product [Ectocarpus sp. CCAP 1310/34]|nr:unnamed protein product [Ectocarpus sp. CCAP 1310/34]
MVSVSRPLLAFAAARAQGRLFSFGTARHCAGFSGPVGEGKPQHDFKVLNRDLAYAGWRKIVKKTVRVEDEKDYVFDVVHQEEPSVAVLVWHTQTNTLTLIKEFAPGREEVAHGVVAGMYEKNKHDSPLQAAKYELEEEAHLLGGTWHTLCEDDETTVNADKYSSNEFYCWLVVDPYVTPTPKPMDDEEFIEIRRGVSMQECMRMVGRGELSIVSSFVVLMGARKLRQLGLLEGDF